VSDYLRRNANLVEMLGGALRDGGHALGAAPSLLRQVLEADGWREFVTQRGEHVFHERRDDWVTTQPLAGLGATVELVERVIGTDDPELLRLWRKAGSVGRGSAGRNRPSTGHVDSTLANGGASDYAAERLARQAPEEYEAVRRHEKTINAAAIAAGIRPHRISVRLDRPDSIARSLRKYMTAEQLAELARLLIGAAE
jgi:hypothetical protein